MPIGKCDQPSIGEIMKVKNSLARFLGIVMVTTVLLAVSVFSHAKRVNKESYYVNKYCEGKIEYRLIDNTRVDCLLDSVASEYDFSDKGYQCIGQALYYGMMTARQPSCVLIQEHENQLKYVKRIKLVARAYQHLNLRVEVIRNHEKVCIINCS